MSTVKTAIGTITMLLVSVVSLDGIVALGLRDCNEAQKRDREIRKEFFDQCLKDGKTPTDCMVFWSQVHH